eukprot:GEMP01083948.1.p1 GENE.GEMP01083948.1~~GEMP01083948.1.p1  ORF type:complete len:205 (+),score=60.13 GEMP01083948.1:42-656(+)
MTTNVVKLFYFDMRGLVEASRIALHAAQVNFEDIRLSKDEWLKMKPTFTFGQMPILEVDGTQTCQSSAILRYAGRLSKLYPEDARQAMEVDEILGILGDIRSKVGPSVHEPDAEKKAEMRAKLANETLPEWFANLDKFLAAKGAAFSAGNNLSVADLELMVLADWLETGIMDGIPADIAQKYAAIMSVVTKTREHPVVKGYYKK